MTGSSTDSIGRPILVLGMERSGTSMVANMIHAWGAYGGDPERLAKVEGWNPHGNWEHQGPIPLITTLLNDSGAHYWEPEYAEALRRQASDPQLRDQAEAFIGPLAANHPVWFLKAPLISVQLPFWKLFLRAPIFVIVVRNPAEAAASLAARNVPSQFPGVTTRALNLLRWQIFYLAILRDTADTCHKLFVDYERVTSAPRDEAARLGEFLRAACAVAPDDRVDRMAEVVRPEARRFRADSFDDDPMATAEQKALYAFLRRKVADPDLLFEAARYPMYPGYVEYFNNFDWVRQHAVPTMLATQSMQRRIRERTLACEQALARVEQAFLAELAKPHPQQQHALVEFLYKERAVYTFGLQLLGQVQQGEA